MFNLNSTVRELWESPQTLEFVARQSGLSAEEVNKKVAFFLEQYGDVSVRNLPKLMYELIVKVKKDSPEEAKFFGTKDEVDNLLVDIEKFYSEENNLNE